MSLWSLSNTELPELSLAWELQGFHQGEWEFKILGNAAFMGEKQSDSQGIARWEGQGTLGPRKRTLWELGAWNRTAQRRLNRFIFFWEGSWETLLRELQELSSCLGRWLLQPEYPQHQGSSAAAWLITQTQKYLCYKGLVCFSYPQIKTAGDT